jgi:hypothetical protein
MLLGEIMSAAHFAAVLDTCVPIPAGAFDRLVAVDKRLRAVAARLEEKLQTVLPVPACQGMQCAPAVCAPAEPRCPLKQLVHEIDLVADKLKWLAEAIEL